MYFVYVKNLGLRDVKVLGECYETVRKIVSAMHFSYCKGAVKDMLTKLTWQLHIQV